MTFNSQLFLVQDIKQTLRNPTLLMLRESSGKALQYQIADIFTKPLDEPTFKRLIVEVGGKAREFDQITSKDAILILCLANGVNIDYARLIWEDIINKLNKKIREKIVSNPRFLFLLLEDKMEGYGNDDVNLNPTQISSVHNWALNKNQPKGPPFIPHMMAICSADELVAFQAPKTSSKAEKKSSLAKDSNPIQHSASNPVVVELHKEDLQATSGSASLGDTGEDKANPHVSSVNSASIHKEPVYSTFTIIHSESTSRPDASTASIAKADAGKYDLHDLVSKQQDKTKSASVGNLNQAGGSIKAVHNVEVDFMDLDSTKYNTPIIIQDEDEEEVHAKKVQAEEPKETKDALASQPLSSKTIKIQEMST
nr:hypothetical protein [Tanacetum cinerariifolium]